MEPYHSSERLFRKYEKILTGIIDAYPNVIEISSEGHNHSTFVARLRNLKTALAKNAWPTTANRKKLLEVGASNIIISDISTGVRCGSAENLRKKLTPIAFEAEIVSANEASLEDLTIDEMVLVCRLADMRLLNRPVRFSIDEDNATRLESIFDISLTKNNDGSYTLL